MSRRKRQRGSSMLEFALCGVPMIFVWISTVQMALGMWHYHTLQYATKAAGAYLSVHGANYIAQGNSAVQIKDVASVLKSTAIGVPDSDIYVTFTAYKSDRTTSTTYNCGSGKLTDCETDTTVWPPSGYNTVGNDFEIATEYQWKNSMAMVAPGGGNKAVNFAAFWLPGHTRQFILF